MNTFSGTIPDLVNINYITNKSNTNFTDFYRDYIEPNILFVATIFVLIFFFVFKYLLKKDIENKESKQNKKSKQIKEPKQNNETETDLESHNKHKNNKTTKQNETTTEITELENITTITGLDK